MHPAFFSNGVSTGNTKLPPIPVRDYVCCIRTHFQGIVYDTKEFGRIIGFAPELLSDVDRPNAYAAHLAVGDTHITMSLTGAYRESGLIYPERLQQGHDWTKEFREFKARVREAICAGLCVDLALGGDGRSKPKNPDGSYPYNDPVGDTYGFEWLMDNLAHIISAFRGDSGSACPDGEDLTPYIIFRPGYDGVFYGWGDDSDGIDRQPQRVMDFGAKFRSILPHGQVSLEFNHLPAGDGGAVFAHGLPDYDTLMPEFDNWPSTGGPAWQFSARLLGSNYRMPQDQRDAIAHGPSDPQFPAANDPHPPFVLVPTPRGQQFACAFEYAKYPESHGGFGSDPDAIVKVINQARAYYRSLGYQAWG